MSKAVTDQSDRVGADARRQLSQPRIAEMIADSLRRRILDGVLADGDALPKMDDLLVEFPVSKPSIREAMRILETEGLISVRRGNVGGAVVHTPKAETAGYMLGVVLQARRTPVSDLAEALLEFEPACAAKAAERPDRNDVLVPQLVALNERLQENIADGPAFTRLARRFHDAVVQGCGSITMSLVVGALETLWSDHESNWAEATSAQGDYPMLAARNAVLRTHIKITQAIEDGDAARTKHLVARHLHESQRYVLAEGRQQLVKVSGGKAVW